MQRIVVQTCIGWYNKARQELLRKNIRVQSLKELNALRLGSLESQIRKRAAKNGTTQMRR